MQFELCFWERYDIMPIYCRTAPGVSRQTAQRREVAAPVTFAFQPLSQDNALVIANRWKYDGVYSFYDMTADLEDYEEFIDEGLRNANDHYQAMADGALAGFFCVIQDGPAIEIGLGLRPDLCGKGVGKGFVDQAVSFIDGHYQFDKLVMHVAVFNQRAVKVYRSCGFRDVKVIQQSSNGGVYEFLVMEKAR